MREKDSLEQSLDSLEKTITRIVEERTEMLGLIRRLSRTTVGHGCVPLEGNDGKSGLIGEARTLLAQLEPFGPNTHAGVWISRETADNIASDGP